MGLGFAFWVVGFVVLCFGFGFLFWGLWLVVWALRFSFVALCLRRLSFELGVCSWFMVRGVASRCVVLYCVLCCWFLVLGVLVSGLII